MDETFDNIQQCDFGYDESYQQGIEDAKQLYILGLIRKSNENNIQKFENQ